MVLGRFFGFLGRSSIVFYASSISLLGVFYGRGVRRLGKNVVTGFILGGYENLFQSICFLLFLWANFKREQEDNAKVKIIRHCERSEAIWLS
jgi:hypothetical protein